MFKKLFILWYNLLQNYREPLKEILKNLLENKNQIIVRLFTTYFKGEVEVFLVEFLSL
jgi:hypothetical protein